MKSRHVERFDTVQPFPKVTIFKHPEYNSWVVGGYSSLVSAAAKLFGSYREAVSFVRQLG